MIRRVNSTERKPIAASSIRTEIIDGSPRTFTADLNFNKSGFPGAAKVVLDATCAGSEIIQRFGFGCIGQIAPEQELRFDDKLTGENIRFTLKIIDVSQEIGKILGIAENIRPVNAGKKMPGGGQGILPLEPRDDLGEQLWRLDFQPQEVILFVNKTVPGLLERFGNDPILHSLVFPSIIREILWRACIHEDYDDDDDHGGWKTLWVRFAKKFDSNRPQTNDDEDDMSNWIESVINQFCGKFHFKQFYSQHAGENS